jgi:uncharacterized protein with HEPN domain
MLRPDSIRLQHMLDAAREAMSFVEGRARRDLDTSRMLVFALIRSLEIIGEAASKISASVQQSYPQIPWAEIIAMRNRLIHAYFDIDLDRVWDTVNEDLPSLIAELETMIVANN